MKYTIIQEWYFGDRPKKRRTANSLPAAKEKAQKIIDSHGEEKNFNVRILDDDGGSWFHFNHYETDHELVKKKKWPVAGQR